MIGCAFSVSFGFLSESLSFASLSSFRCAATATDTHDGDRKSQRAGLLGASPDVHCLFLADERLSRIVCFAPGSDKLHQAIIAILRRQWRSSDARFLPPIGCTGLPFSLVDADLLVMPWFEDEGPAAVPASMRLPAAMWRERPGRRNSSARPFDIFSTASPTRHGVVTRGASWSSAPGSARASAPTSGASWRRPRRCGREQRRSRASAFVMRADARR